MTATQSVSGLLEISTEIGYPIIVAMLMGLHCLKVSFGVSAVRYKNMDDAYIEEHFKDENKLHLEAFGCPIAKGGHPGTYIF